MVSTNFHWIIEFSNDFPSNSRFKHVISTYVYIRNSAPKPTRRSGNGKPTGRDCGPVALPSARYRADPRYKRRLAATPRSGRVSRLIATRTTANLSRESQVFAHHQTVGRGGEESTTKTESQQPGRGRHRGDEGGREGAAGGGVHQHDGADMLTDAQGASYYRGGHAAVAAVVWD